MKKKINSCKLEIGMAPIDPASERRKQKQLGIVSVSCYPCYVKSNLGLCFDEGLNTPAVIVHVG